MLLMRNVFINIFGVSRNVKVLCICSTKMNVTLRHVIFLYMCKYIFIDLVNKISCVGSCIYFSGLSLAKIIQETFFFRKS